MRFHFGTQKRSPWRGGVFGRLHVRERSKDTNPVSFQGLSLFVTTHAGDLLPPILHLQSLTHALGRDGAR